MLVSRLRVALYLLLLFACGLTLWARPFLLAQIRSDALPAYWILVGPVCVGVLLSLLMIDVLFIRKTGQTRLSAVAPLVLGGVLLLIVLPSGMREFRTRKAPEIASEAFFSEMLKSSDPRVRALVMTASTCSLGTDSWTPILSKGLADADPLVRRAAVQAISWKTGIELDEEAKDLTSAMNLLNNLESPRDRQEMPDG